MKENVFHIPKKSEITRRNSCKDIGRSLDQARKKNGMVNTCPRPKGKWNSVAKHMHQRFEETGHPIFKGVSAMNRGVLRRKNKCTIHFTAETSNVELLFPTHSAIQLSIYGAVAIWSGQHGPKETELISEKFVTSEASVNTETPKRVHSQKSELFGGLG